MSIAAQTLIIYNTNIAQSLTDATAYQTLRGMPTNLLGINFGTTPGAVTNLALYSVQANTFKWQGTIINTYDGQTLDHVLGTIAANIFFLGVILSTFTPLVYSDSNGTTTLPGHLGEIAYGFPPPSGFYAPAGRLGSPALSSSTFNFNNELVCRSGQAAALQASTNAVAAEKTYNFPNPHVATSGTGGGPNIGASWNQPSFNFNASYYASILATLQAKCAWTIDMGVHYPFGTAAGNDFQNGTQPAPLDTFAFCLPMSMNTSFNPGAAPYSNNYTVRPGGWSVHWWSFQWNWAMDFLYNGGSAAFTTIAEPQSFGIRDPLAILQNLFTGVSMMEAWLNVPISFPGTTWVRPGTICVIGDPLYRPYAQQSPPSMFGANAPAGLIL